jgi:hypothetical protein
MGNVTLQSDIVAHQIIKCKEQGRSPFPIFCQKILSRKCQVWEVVVLLHGNDVNRLMGCTGELFYNGETQRLALCELTDWVQTLLIDLYKHNIDLIAQKVPPGIIRDIQARS